MKHILYLVTTLKKKHPVNIANKGIVELKLSWTPGMVGVLPVFSNYQSALEYANNDKSLVVELEIIDEK